MERSTRRLVSIRSVASGFLVALLVLAAIGIVVGIDTIVDVIAGADPLSILAALSLTAVWITAFGLSLSVTLDTLGVDVSPQRSILIYASAVFLNSLTPFAQIGGEALSAVIVTRSTDARYETGLAAITAVDVVNLVPSPLFALSALAAVVLGDGWSSEFRVAALSALGIAVALVVGVGLAWWFRDGVTRTIVAVVTTVNSVTGRGVGLDPADLFGQVESYLDGVGRVFGDRRALATCLGLSVVGWAALVASFWLSLRAVGHPIPLPVAAFVLPVGLLAIVVPLPGGVGGVEVALTGLLVTVGGVPLAPATAGVLVYRGVSYWAPFLFGGLVTVALVVRHRLTGRGT